MYSNLTTKQQKRLAIYLLQHARKLAPNQAVTLATQQACVTFAFNLPRVSLQKALEYITDDTSNQAKAVRNILQGNFEFAVTYLQISYFQVSKVGAAPYDLKAKVSKKITQILAPM